MLKVIDHYETLISKSELFTHFNMNQHLFAYHYHR